MIFANLNIMKKNKLFIASLVIVLLGVTIGWYLKNNATKNEPASTSSDFNPNYADAIQQKKPELCSDIVYALKSGPTDKIDRIYGTEAITLCKSQAKNGRFECECNADRVLNSMREE